MSDTVRSSTAESEFVLTTAFDGADQECACDGCHDDVDDRLSLQLSCDFGGSAADYGHVGFCSIPCACEFSRGAPYEVVDNDILIHMDNPIIVEVTYTGTDEFTPEGDSEPVTFGDTFAAITGRDIEPMMATATEIIVDTVDAHNDVTPHTFNVASHWL